MPEKSTSKQAKRKTVNVNKQGYGVNSKGLLEYRTEQKAAESEETNASSIEAGKYVYAKAKEDLKVKVAI